MKPSSASSSSSPTVYKSNSRPQSSTIPETPSIIPLDYNYQIMAPSSLRPQTARYSLVSRSSTRQSNTDVDIDMDEDLPYNSLFGDPVPPQITSNFQTSQFLHHSSMDVTSEEEQTLGQTMTLLNSSTSQRLFPQEPYTTLMSKRFSNSSSQRNFEIVPSSIPKLKPPDIQILPNSSEGSSSEARNPPNFMLLPSQDMSRNSSAYNNQEETEDVSELKETYTIKNGQTMRELIENTSIKSSKPKPIADMQSLSPPFHFESSVPHQFSNETYSSGEWFRMGNLEYSEFNKMPKLRPSSKNVMSIKRDKMPLDSPVAAMINDSNGSSSGEERLLGTTQILDQPTISLDILLPPERPPSPSPSCLRSLENTIVLSPREYIKQRRKSIYSAQMIQTTPPDEEEKPPPIPPKPQLVEENVLSKTQTQTQTPIKREVTPVIIKDSITTGGDFRVEQTRLHKKTSFTIISDKSPHSSQPPSPRYLRTREHTSTSVIPIKPKPQLQQKSLSSSQLKLPHLMHLTSNILPADDSPRLSVQFDMSGGHSPTKLPFQKGILQHKASLANSQDLPPTYHMSRRTSLLPKINNANLKTKIKSCEALPLITDPYRTSIPRLNRSSIDLGPESVVFPPGGLPRPLKPNPNPTRQQKGLLKILNQEEILSRLPLKSNWSSMDDLWLESKKKPSSLSLQDKTMRRRSSSTSPSRRSSTQTTSDRRSSNLSSVTTSDFSFRRPSVLAKPKTPQNQRKKSVFQPPSPLTRRKSSSTSSNITTLNRPTRTKIAKPSTLSPIIGTPNKDSSSAQSPLHAKRLPAPSSDSVSDSNSRRGSLSKIPLRSQTNSRSNSRLSIHSGSKAASRSVSPNKNYTNFKDLQDTGGRLSQLANKTDGYSRIDSPLREYLETGGRLSQLAVRSGVHSRTPSPTKDHSRNISRSRASSKDGSTRANQIIATSSRSGSRASQYLTSLPSSIAQSRANSRAHSRSTSRASTRPVSLPGSRPTSRLEHAKDIANSRSNSRISLHSTKRTGSTTPVMGRKPPSKAITSRRKSVSLSPTSKKRDITRKKSLSPRGKHTREARSQSRIKASSSPDISVKSRIPVSHIHERSSNRSPQIKRKPNATTDVRKTSFFKSKPKIPTKQPASAKKIPTSIRKPEPSVKRTPSSVEKQTGLNRKQTTGVQKTPLNEKQASTVTKQASNVGKPLTYEATSLLVLKKAINKKASVMRKKTNQEADKDKTGMMRNKSGATVNAAAVAETNKSAEVKKKTDEHNDGSATTIVPVPVLDTLKRQPSSVSLMRVSSKISLLRKRSDSNISKKTLDALVPNKDAFENEVSASSPTQQLMEKVLAEGGSVPAAIIEKSQKTLENIQKTVTEATEEIQKTISENLTDLKSFEQDMGLTSDSAGSPTPSVTTVVEKKSRSSKETGVSVSRQGTAEGVQNKPSSKSPLPPSQPIEAAVSVVNPTETQITAQTTNGSTKHDTGLVAGSSERVSERAISVLPEVDSESANLQSYQNETRGRNDDKVQSSTIGMDQVIRKDDAGAVNDYEDEAKRRSPDGQGGSQVDSGKGSGSQEYLENKSLSDEDDTASKGCCRCCAKFCMPCRRLRCSRCCQRKKLSAKDEAEEPVLSATSSATTTHLEIANEKHKTSCWKKINCCKSCRKKTRDSIDSSSATLRQEEAAKVTSVRPMGPPKQSKCGLCLSKIFCCRSVNKIDPKTGDETEVKKCCFCIPCRKKRETMHGSTASSVAGGSAVAWEDPERGISANDAAIVEGQDVEEAKSGCCKRFCNFLLCCRKQKVAVTDSRRPSIRAPPPEETRRKLHADLVEYTSKMKGAIPVLPLWLAWFCAICNALVPGLGTLLSGMFCLCVGIPRFSLYDSAKARVGSFIINTIVAVSQLFCVLFCFVGWGWSIWWGTIMLKCARKLSKIRKVERLEMEEEKRQAAAAEAAAAAAVKTSNTEPETVKS